MYGGQIQTSEIPQDERGTNKTLPMKKRKSNYMRKGESRDTGKRLRDGRLNVEGGSDVCCSVAWSYRIEAAAATPGAKQELRGNKKRETKTKRGASVGNDKRKYSGRERNKGREEKCSERRPDRKAWVVALTTNATARQVGEGTIT